MTLAATSRKADLFSFIYKDGPIPFINTIDYTIYFDFDTHSPGSPTLAQLLNDVSRENMEKLGCGSGDLAVILLGPVILIYYCELMAGDINQANSQILSVKSIYNICHKQLNAGYLYICVFNFYLGYIYKIIKYKKSEKYI
ncbi:Uncharacterized protein HZ326_13895 [Fusarium oxysporum f. sp. albedinis]|nr:Uncharacterized protein HZ326_13895 [Fusarium oxysporum f. sp. albedinis]